MHADIDAALEARIAALDWTALADALDKNGYAATGPLLSPADCAALVESYAEENLFRRKVVMGRHGYGQGEYQYFAYPLPDFVAALRTAFYPPLAAIANRWNEALRIETRYSRKNSAGCERA